MQYGQTFLVLRRLLARIRDVMAEEGDPQRRLDRVVTAIAEDMRAEVCSLYVRRAGDVLELFATQGLRQSAVHTTRLRVSEGLIGEIAAKARPLALADAQNHPSFVYRPETGEEVYHSLMGVPVLRGGRVLGVLAVQSRTRRQYADEEIEALQTVAMVLAEVLDRGDLVGRAELARVEGTGLLPARLEGVAVCAGLGIGVAVPRQPLLSIRRIVAEDTRIEHERLRQAVADMHGALEVMFGSSDMPAAGEHRDVLETYRMIAEDVGWLRRIGEAINSGLTAEAAVQKVADDIRTRLGSVADSYLRERVHDLEDLARRLMQHLIGSDAAAADMPANGDLILIASSMGPAELLDFDRGRLRGVVLEEGSPASHVAIVARALDLPVVGQVRGALNRIEAGDLLIVDGDHGQVLVRPGEDVRMAFVESLRARNERKAGYAALRDLPAETADGARVTLNINAGLLVDMMHLSETGADGVGLYRTEVPFMVRPEMPDVESQRTLYRRVLDHANGRPVVFRTLDVGGDKVLPYLGEPVDENPAMGWRAIRVSFDRPAMLRQQLRALIRAAAGGPLSVMFPMITEVAELDYARALLDRELDRQRERGDPLPTVLRVGAMLEVPALLFQLPALFARVEFVSIGSNDLFQFLRASDRSSARTSERYDTLSPLVLGLLRNVVRHAEAAGVPVSLCGEMASRPLEAMALMGVGLRNISVAPPAVGPVKTMIRSLTVSTLEKYMESLYDSTSMSVRDKLQAFAADHGVII